MSSINLGTAGVQALTELRGNRQVEDLMIAITQLVQKRLIGAVNAPVENRIDETAYARGLHDLWAAMHGPLANLHVSQVKLPVTPSASAQEPLSILDDPPVPSKPSGSANRGMRQ